MQWSVPSYPCETPKKTFLFKFCENKNIYYPHNLRLVDKQKKCFHDIFNALWRPTKGP